MAVRKKPEHGMVALTERDRAVIRTLAATVLCPGALVRQAHFSQVTHEVYRRSAARLEHLGLVERVRLGPTALSRRQGEMLLFLSPAGWHLAADMDVRLPPEAVRRQARAMPAEVAAAAEGYVLALTSGALAAGGRWELPPSSGRVPAPPGAWAILSLPGRVLALDLALAGRSPAQGLARRRLWAPGAGVLGKSSVRFRVCYVVSETARREQLKAAVAADGEDWPWLMWDHPHKAVQAVLSPDTHGG